MIAVGHKNYAGVSTREARTLAEKINKHLSDAHPVYVMFGVIAEYHHGGCTVRSRSHDSSEEYNAEITPEGKLASLEHRIFDEDG